MSNLPVTGSRVPLGDILAYHVACDGHRPALTQDGVTLTHAELDARANRRARMLARHSVGLGDYVIIALPNSIEFFETTFALWKLGAVPCPISPKMPAAECSAIVESISPRLVIGSSGLSFVACPTLVAGTQPDAEDSDLPLPSRVSPSWKAITSGGSTGRPKVIVTAIDGKADPASGGYALQQAGDTILNPGPLYHNAAFSAAHQCLFSGGHVVNMARFDAEASLDLIARYHVDYVMMVPTMMGRIWRLPDDVRANYDLSCLRVLVHLGGPCPQWLKQNWIDWIGPEKVFEIYAGTEGIGATVISGAEWLNHRGSVGRPASGAEMKIVGPDGQEAPVGETGEIFFRSGAGGGPNFRYIGAEMKEAEGWMSLGDLGHVDADGYLYISDRRTDLIVSGAVNIYPAEVEAAIDSHPAVRTSVVIGLPDDDLGNRVHAIVQLSPLQEESLDASRLADHLATRLARYKIPRSFEFVTEDIRDEAGKARRSQFRQQRLLQESTPE